MHVSESATLRLICEWLIKTVLVYFVIIRYTDNCGNSRANTCSTTRLFEELYLLAPEPFSLRGFWMIHDKRTKRMA